MANDCGFALVICMGVATPGLGLPVSAGVSDEANRRFARAGFRSGLWSLDEGAGDVGWVPV